jgi:hypothetical protein
MDYKSWYQAGIAQYKNSNLESISSRVFEGVMVCILLYVTYDVISWMHTWWKPDYSTIGDYLNVKLPHLIIGSIGMIMIPWLSDLFTPCSYMREAGKDPKASSNVLCAQIIGMALILMK